MEIGPDQVVEEIARRTRVSQPLRVFWVTLQVDRDKFSTQLTSLRERKPIVPCTLRGAGFSDPNSIMNDVAGVLERARRDVIELRSAAMKQRGVDIVLLSRRELNLAVTSSPILLPEWFPVAAGQTVTARIEDLTWSTTILLNDSSLELHDLQRILFEIENYLISIIQRTLDDDPERVKSFWDRIRGTEDFVTLDRAIPKMQRALERIESATSYRPSRKSGTIVGRLWSHANSRPPEELVRIAKALAQALKWDQRIEADYYSLIAVLNRPTNPIGNVHDRLAFNMIITLRSACQMVTAAAHADEYPRFPILLLQSTCRDTKRFLDTVASALSRSDA